MIKSIKRSTILQFLFWQFSKNDHWFYFPENTWKSEKSRKFLITKIFAYKVFWYKGWTNFSLHLDFSGVPFHLPAELGTQKNGSTKPKCMSDQKTTRIILTKDLWRNVKSQFSRPIPHVTWKPKSHVELFSMQKTDLEKAPKWIFTAFWLLL